MNKTSHFLTDIKKVLVLKKPGNIKVIILCILGAAVFWLFNALNKDYTTNVSYPIEFDYNDEDFIPVSDLPEELNLNLSGGGWNLLRRTNWFNIDPIIIPLQNPTEINRVYAASWRGIISDHLPDFRLNFVVTDSVKLNFQRKIRKKIPFTIDSLSADLSEGYRIISTLITTTDSIEFEGPIEILDTIQVPYIITIEGRNISNDFKSQVAVLLNYPNLVKVEPSVIGLQFKVAEFIRKTLQIPSTSLNFPDSTIYLSDSLVTISFTVQIDLQELIVPDSFRITSDYKRRVKSDSSIQPLIKHFPQLIDEISIDSDRLKISYDQ